MSGEPQMTIVGNLTNDPELRFTPSGAAVASFTIAQTPRTKKGDEWVDGEALFMRCSAWRGLAENIAESLQKGTRVVVLGRVKQRSFEDREGNKRTVIEMDVDAIGPDLTWATAKVSRVGRSGGQQNGQQGQQRQQPQRQQGSGQPDPWGAPADDPWSTPAPPADRFAGGPNF